MGLLSIPQLFVKVADAFIPSVTKVAVGLMTNSAAVP